MTRAIAVLALCASCVSWDSTITFSAARTVQLDPIRGADCAHACRANDARCLAACPGSVTRDGECGDADPGACVDFAESSTIEREGRCSELVPQLESEGVIATACIDNKHATGVGIVGAAVAVVGLVFLAVLGVSVL